MGRRKARGHARKNQPSNQKKNPTTSSPQPGPSNRDKRNSSISSNDIDIDSTCSDGENPQHKIIQQRVHTILENTAVNNMLMIPGERSFMSNDLFYQYINLHPKPMIIEPECKLCKEEIITEGHTTVHDGVKYTMYFIDDICKKNQKYRNWEKTGSFQCVYCLNDFHRWKCSLSMSQNSYIETIKSRSWACPTCVPAFLPRAKNKAQIVKRENKSMYDYIISIFTLLNKSCNIFDWDEMYFTDYVSMITDNDDNVEHQFDNG
jgi:hypothetical protein